MSASRFLSPLSSRLPSLSLKLIPKSLSPSISPLKSTSQAHISASTKRISRISRSRTGLSNSPVWLPRKLGKRKELGILNFARLPVELSCLVSMMPLHSAIASARLKSNLSIDSQSWGLIPQGMSMPL